MNELAARWAAHPEWAARFSESDRLVVASLARRACEVDPAAGPLDESDDPGALALLHLARSLRLEHAALSLDEAVLTRVISENADRADAAAATEARAVIGALSGLATAWLAAVVERVDLADPVGPTGAPVLVAWSGGAPAFVHVRRLAHAEDRLASALLAAATPAPWGALAPDELVAAQGALGTSPARAVLDRLARHRVSLLTGGPGTGKSTTVARVLSALADARAARGPGTAPLSVALCAPTARAAVRLREVLASALTPGTSLRLDDGSGSLHHLLGLRPDRPAVLTPVTCDLVVVDEASMADLPLLDHLLAAASPTTRVVLAGDPDQLASVHVGAALRDVVDAARHGPLADLLTQLTTNHRSRAGIVALAAAANAGDAAALAAAAARYPDEVTLTTHRERALADVLAGTAALADRALAGDRAGALAALGARVVLCATREGDGSVAWWRDRLEGPTRLQGAVARGWAPGTPVLVTRNEPTASGADRLTNGDVGVVVATGGDPVVAFGPPEGVRARAPHDLLHAEPAWALTIHKAQGSEYPAVVVSLPGRDAPILTRELLYTAITRARAHVVIAADPAVLARALGRRIARVSGLAERIAARAAAREPVG